MLKGGKENFMDENKKFILEEVYKAEIARLTKEDFEFVRNKVVQFAIARYSTIFNETAPAQSTVEQPTQPQQTV